MFMGLQGVKHFAGGTGFWSKLLSNAGKAVSNIAGSAWSGLKNGVDKFTKMFSYITGAVADPSGTLGKVLNLKSGGVSSVMDGVAGGAYKKVTSTAKDWWSTLWSMASESSSSGTGSKGDDYAYKNKSKDSGVDPWGYFYRECVSFIASRLKNLGVSASLFSHLGNGADWVNAKVPHSKTPKVGDVAVYAAGSEFGNHASIVTGVQGDRISGEEYNWSGDGQYHTYNGRRASGATTFLDFGRSAGAKAKEVATNNPLSKLIKKQTGGMMSWIQKFIAPINDSSTGADNDVQSWSGDVKKALSKLGLSTSGSMVSKVLKQIQTESGGNARARGGNDGLTDGNATGLMQVKPGTFRAYAVDGHNNIMNGYDNILAGLNYAKHRYGDSLSFLGRGHGYANGGLITKHQIAEIGEGNKPEMIIPLDGMKSSRGFELLGKTAVAMAQRDGATGSSATSDSSTLEAKIEQGNQLLNSMVQLLSGILGQTTEANQSVDDITMNKFSKAIINKAVRSVN
ncbi:CHAP domain-containing protein [Leuconostoc mesenteroides]|uniref:CHAP domain-containing protein n=1 Tax=Leuconostoc mesenteroides TaxID=1245 RepID=UPI00235E8A60|nr:CHAP domain-containing protein [Leuconostoc mesenteroides]